MPNTSRSLIDTKALMLPVALAVLLVFSSQISFLLFHTLAEFFAIVVAVLTTVVAWQMYAFTRNHFLMYLGCGYFWIAALDMMHALTYKGMSIIATIGTDITVQLWIGTRYLEAILLLSAPWFLSHSLKRNFIFTLFSIGALTLIVLIMSGNFPVGFVEGKGLTKFKIYSEYVIIGMLAAGIFYLTRQRKLMDQRVFMLMIASIVLTMMAELAFTFFVSLYGLSNLAGHIFKLFSFWLIFVAVVRTTLREPFSALSKAETYYDAVPNATIIVDDKGIIQHVNGAACSLANQSSVKMIGKHTHSIFHGESVTQKDCPICQSIINGTGLSAYELKIDDTYWCDFTTSVIRGENSSIQVIRDITDKKNSAIALEKSETRLAITLNSIGDAVITTNTDGHITSMNPVAEQLTGWSFAEAQGQSVKTVFPIVNASNQEPITNPIEKVMATGEIVYLSNHTTLIAKDGTEYQIADSAAPIRDGDGDIQGMVLVFNNVTEEYRLREAANKSRRDLQAIMNNTPAVIYVKDRDGRFTFINQKFENLFQIQMEDIIGKTLHDVFPPDIADEMQRNDKAVLKAGHALESEEVAPHSDGLHTYSSIKFPLSNGDGKIYAVCGISTDITDKMKSEEALAKSFKEWTFAMDFFEDAIYLIDLDNKLIRANQTFYRMTGLTPDTAIGHNIITILHPGCEEIPCPVCNACKERRDEVIIMEADHPDNPVGRPIQVTVQIIRDNEGAPLSMLMGIHDLSDMRAEEVESEKLQHQLHQSQKMDALGKLTGGIAHDYNNMLGVILGYSELLEEELSKQPELVKYAHEIHHAGTRGVKLTKSLLAFSRAKASEADRLNLNALLQNEQHMLEKTLTVRIKLVLNLQENLWPVYLDDSDMEDAILNMSINAMHAIEGNGQLTMQTRNQTINQIDAQSLGLTAGDYVLLNITDTGCGMDEATKEKIFDPFFSTKGEKGTGLGLSQVYGFVRRSGGAIKVHSELNHGTQFTLYFPRYYESSLDVQSAKNHPVTTFTANKSILVVDDEQALLTLTCKILSKHGFNVSSAENAKQALDILEHEAVDLLITDIIMPEMDGYQLAAIVKEKYPAIKIQLASGFTDDRNIDMVDERLQQNLLVKPFNSQVLLQRINELFNENK